MKLSPTVLYALAGGLAAAFGLGFLAGALFAPGGVPATVPEPLLSTRWVIVVEHDPSLDRPARADVAGTAVTSSTSCEPATYRFRDADDAWRAFQAGFTAVWGEVRRLDPEPIP